jgi:mRNA interferase RelE/StbE
MPYTVSFKASAAKQVEKLPRTSVRKVLAKANALGTNPRPSGSVKLTGVSNIFRVRQGDYRIVYAVDDEAKNVDIRIVAHRREVYRGL